MSAGLTTPSPSVITTGPCTVSSRRRRCGCQVGTYVAASGPVKDLICSTCLHSFLDHDPSSASADDASQGSFHQSNGREVRLESKRVETVGALWKELQTYGVIQVRGTPASGKTTLARLLAAHIRHSDPSFTVVEATYTTRGSPPRTPFRVWLKAVAGLDIRGADNWRFLSNTVFIFDDAQLSHGDMEFWVDYLKPLTAHRPDFSPLVILFSSYGSPGTFADEAPGTAPVPLAREQRVSVRALPSNNGHVSLYFTSREFDDVVERFSLAHTSEYERFQLETDLHRYLYDLTSGHPAAVRIVLELLRDSEECRSYVRAQRPIPLKEALAFIYDNGNFFTVLWSSDNALLRSFPSWELVSPLPHARNILVSALHTGSIQDDLSVDGLGDCFKRGWLQAEVADDYSPFLYLYPTRLHLLWAEHLLRAFAPAFPVSRFPTLELLCFAALRAFDATALTQRRLSLGVAAQPRTVDAQYQDEFYRACSEVLGHAYLRSEWADPSLGTTGRADFFIPDVGWAIKLLRDGDNIEEHIARSLPNGRYYGAMVAGRVKSCIMLDFRQTTPRKAGR